MITDAIRVLMLDDDNHTPSYHSEDIACWHDANHFIKWLTHDGNVPKYEVRKLAILDVTFEDLDFDVETMFDIVHWRGRGYSFEEYQEAFNHLWEVSEEI